MAATTIKDGYAGGSDNQLKVNSDGSINVTGGGSGGSNPSVGNNGVVAPASATEIAGIDPNGNLKPVSVDINGFVNVQGVSTITGPVSTVEKGLNSFKTSQFTIGTSISELTPIPLAGRSSVSLRVSADVGIAVYISQSATGTVSDGYPLYDRDTLQLDLTDASKIYAITTVADQIVATLEIA